MSGYKETAGGFCRDASIAGVSAFFWFFLLFSNFTSGMGPVSCARISKDGEKAFITDRTGERWDISQAVEPGFDPDRFQYGIGRHAFKPLDSSDLSDDTASVSGFERVIGVANEKAAHAYSIRKLRRHEVANTLLGDVPIAVGY